VLGTTLALIAAVSFSTVADASTQPAPVATQQALSQFLIQGEKLMTLPSTVVSLANVGHDWPDTHRCLINAGSSNPITQRPANSVCTFGDVSASASIAVFGDSQADMWMSALSRFGKAFHYRVIEFTLGNCDTSSLDLWNNTTNAPGTACTSFRAWAIQKIKGLHPRAVILSNFPNRTNYQHHELSAHAYEQGIEATLKKLSAPGRKLILFGRIPEPSSDPAQCLAAYPSAIQHCSVALKTTAPGEYLALLIAGAKVEQATVVNTNPWMCANGICPVVANHTILYYNQYHASNHWVTEIAPVIVSQLRAFLGK
jgi:hypothetical protein